MQRVMPCNDHFRPLLMVKDTNEPIERFRTALDCQIWQNFQEFGGVAGSSS